MLGYSITSIIISVGLLWGGCSSKLERAESALAELDETDLLKFHASVCLSLHDHEISAPFFNTARNCWEARKHPRIYHTNEITGDWDSYRVDWQASNAVIYRWNLRNVTAVEVDTPALIPQMRWFDGHDWYEWHTNHDTALWTYRRLEGK